MSRSAVDITLSYFLFMQLRTNTYCDFMKKILVRLYFLLSFKNVSSMERAIA